MGKHVHLVCSQGCETLCALAIEVSNRKDGDGKPNSGKLRNPHANPQGTNFGHFRHSPLAAG
ncbi:hypothetical protein ANCDUO_12170 [Ancylostoma duodenale]|uniref:Uncharacterized protein n=1 Tax=Ancylostoma duodenale TaxID=51022 RepID=A0A0C2D692_9BILA|nr:hypothetical protein ANCDUO_12170 [Ancylostoma duodenale]